MTGESKNRFGRGRAANVVPLRNWIDQCQNSKTGPLPNLYNTTLALQHDPVWFKNIRFDAMLQVATLFNHPISDADIVAVQRWIQEAGIKRVPRETVRDALGYVAREHRHHPLRERLAALEWDGEARLSSWISKFLGADNNEYHRQIAAKWLVALVARVFQPGCKSDHMLVLEGPQRALKSSLLEAIAKPYFSDSLPDLHGDAIRLSMHLRGKWLIEVSELSAFSKAETSKLKAFITTQVEQYVPKFGHNEVHEPRQCLFAGTTNDDQYLKDETGNRRYWPVKCRNILLDPFKAELPQILAEAVKEFNEGAAWWIEPNLEKEIFEPEQAKRLWVDAWEPKVRDYLRGKAETGLLELAENALGFTPARFGTAEQRRLVALLKFLGWELKRTNASRIWIKPNIH